MVLTLSLLSFLVLIVTITWTFALIYRSQSDQFSLQRARAKKEQEKYLVALGKYAQKWQRLNFIAQARLVAYGFRNDVHNIDDRHNEIMSIMTPERIAELYQEIASFSGIPLPEDNNSTEEETVSEEVSSSESSEETTTQEPVDPKV